MITDSGFGGLSLAARLESRLARAGAGARLTYVNACPSEQLGYNGMASQERRLRTLGAVLAAIDRRFEPDAIVVACNTLSVLLEAGAPRPARPIRAILDAGADLLVAALRARPGVRALVLATPISAAARPWSARLRAAGIADGRLVVRACPGLESVISSDRDGEATRAALAVIAGEFADVELAAVLLGCTHYSLRAPEFARCFAREGLAILDPVEVLADELEAGLRGPPGVPVVRFFTRYAPPRSELDAVTALLAASAPRSAAAVAQYDLDETLFDVAPP